MIYEEKIQIPSSTKIVKHKIASCVKCGNDDININEYEDEFGFISTVTCKKCKNETKENRAQAGAIKSWNQQNDIPTLIRDKKKLILKTQVEIKNLLKLKTKRKKKK